MSAHTLREEVARIIDPKAYEDFPVGGTEPHHDWLDRERALAIADQILELPDLALFDRPSVPDGWRLVPEEPTRTMLDAGWEAGVEWGDTKANGKHARRKWAAMLAGAPDFFAENAKNSAPSPPVGGWRSMDSAPKDGTTFDAWAVCPRAPGHQVRFTDVQMRGDKSGFGVVLHRPEAQWEYLERDGGIYPEWRLTHWCPLPPPPEGDAL